MVKSLVYKDVMKIGYGYKRAEQSFRKYGVSHVWNDTEPDRIELAYLMGAQGKPPGIKPGETLILLHHADIGDHWKARRRILEWLASNNIKVQVRDQDAVLYDSEEKLEKYKSLNGGDKTQVDGGRPRKVKWTAETAQEFGEAWFGPFSMAYCRTEHKRITGRVLDEKARANLNYLFGPRDGSRKDRYNLIKETSE